MSRLLLFATFGVLFINISCERCMKCSYSYTEVTYEETPEGEVEVRTEHENVSLYKNGVKYSDECFKRKEYKGIDDDSFFTIDEYYYADSASSELENYRVNCYEL